MVILDDVLPEETECFTFNIESLNPDLIEVDEERAQKRLCILDNDEGMHEVLGLNPTWASFLLGKE